MKAGNASFTRPGQSELAKKDNREDTSRAGRGKEISRVAGADIQKGLHYNIGTIESRTGKIHYERRSGGQKDLILRKHGGRSH